MANGTEVGSLYYDLDIDDDKLRKGLNNSSKHVDGFGDKLKDFGKKAAVALAAVGVAVAAFGVASVKAFSESEDAIAQTNAVLKSTKGIAGVTAEQVDQLSTSLQKLTKFSDEEVRSAQNMLLTFTNIGKDVFPDATKTVLDMSAALGQDLKSSSIQLGKALNDPIAGITALQRVGVKFTESQKEQIEVLVKSGKTMEAQKLILKELQTEFGGSAEAAGNTFAGKLKKLQNALNDVQEAIGYLIVNALEPLFSKLAQFVNAVDWAEVLNKTKQALSDLWNNYLAPFGRAVGEAARQIGEYLQPKIEDLASALQQIGPELKDFWDSFLGPLLKGIGIALVVLIGLIIDVVTEIVKFADKAYNFLKPALDGLKNAIVNDLVPALQKLWEQAGPILEPVLKALAWLLGTVLVGAAYALIWVLTGLIKIISGIIDAASAVIKWFRDHWQSLAGIISGAVSPIYNALIKPFKDFLDFIKDIPDKVGDVVKKIGGVAGKSVLNSLSGGLTGGLSGLLKLVPGRAVGGPVSAQSPYIVGERGPELFVPNKSGTIIPNGGGASYNFGDVILQDAMAVNHFFDLLDRRQQLESMGLSGL